MFHFGAFSIIAFIFSSQFFILLILLPGFVNGIASKDVCFFRIPLKSPSMCLSFLLNSIEPPTVNTLALKKDSAKFNSCKSVS